MCCYCMKYETKILVTCWPLNNWWQLSSKTHNSFAPLTVPGNYILSSKMNFQLHRVSFSSKLFRNNVTHHLMISPVPPQRWLNFSTRQGDPGPHEDAPLKLWPALNSAAAVLSGISEASSPCASPAAAPLKCAHHCPLWVPAEECSLLALAGRAPGRRRAVWDSGICTAELKGVE